MEDKVLALISLAQSAGKLVSGEQGASISISKNKGKLIFIAGDASDNTKKKFINQGKYRKVPICIGFTKDILGNRIGKSPRSILVVEDEGFVKGMIGHIKDIPTLKFLEVDLCQE